MSVSGEGVSMMEALSVLVLKESGTAVAGSSAATSSVAPLASGTLATHDSDEEEEVECSSHPAPKFGSGVLEEPCSLSPFRQTLAFNAGEETVHLRSQGFHPSHIAAMLGREEVFWWIVNHDEDLRTRTHAGNNVLHLAAEYGHESLVRGIYERFGGTMAPYDKRVDQKATNEAKQTALHLAAAHGHFSIVKYLVETVKLSVRDRDIAMHTPLMLAAQNGHLAVVKYLQHKRPASLSEAGQYKYTALLLAALQGQYRVVRYIMMNGGSNKELTNLNNTALHIACMGGHVDIVQLLLDKYSDQFILTDKNSNGQTPLHLAAWAGHDALTKLLITKYSAPTNITNSKGNTAFLMACLRGHLSVAKILITIGHSQFTEVNKNRNNAMLLAAYGGHNDVIEWLADPMTNSGLSIHDRSLSGNTPLLHAASQALLHTVQYLLSLCNANINDTNNSGKDAVELSSSFTPVHDYLLAWKLAANAASSVSSVSTAVSLSPSLEGTQGVDASSSTACTASTMSVVASPSS